MTRRSERWRVAWAGIVAAAALVTATTEADQVAAAPNQLEPLPLVVERAEVGPDRVAQVD